MAKQVRVEELDGKKSYMFWLFERSNFSGILARYMYETDFRSSIDDDKIQMEKALELRKEYAESVYEGANERASDRVWKSILGPCSMLEMVIYLADSIDKIVNESEENRYSEFFHILVDNAKLTKFDDEDYDLKGDTVLKYWLDKIDFILDRKYSKDGKGGFFPLEKPKKDQRKVPIWYQMNAWLEENSDDDGEFLLKNEVNSE